MEHRWVGPGPEAAPTLVFLHAGLGCARSWGDLPEWLAAATGTGALVYSRRGYGGSGRLPGPWSTSFLHDEARLALYLLDEFAIRDALLIGHSDGGSIALLAGSDPRLRALVLEAPHTHVEPLCRAQIAQDAKDYPERLRDRFQALHGADADQLFRAWTEVWLSEEFARWDIRGSLPAVSCPVLLIQGAQDAYGTRQQVESVKAGVSGRFEELWLEECGHAPHRDHPERVREAMRDFILRL